MKEPHWLIVALGSFLAKMVIVALMIGAFIWVINHATFTPLTFGIVAMALAVGVVFTLLDRPTFKLWLGGVAVFLALLAIFALVTGVW